MGRFRPEREEEIALAKKIEVTRKRFRRSRCSATTPCATSCERLKRYHAKRTAFDRTIQVYADGEPGEEKSPPRMRKT